MSFTDFPTIAEVQERFLIKYQSENFIRANPVTVSQELIDELEFTEKFIDTHGSEFAIRENWIFPVLKTAYRPYADVFSLWSHRFIPYDEVLAGTPDYLVAKRSPLGKTVLEKPLLLVMEAKKNDFDAGWGQCLAAMVAAQKMNDQAVDIYGIVTDGKIWQFGQLVRDFFTFNIRFYTLDDLPVLMGALDFIYNQLQAQLICCVN